MSVREEEMTTRTEGCHEALTPISKGRELINPSARVTHQSAQPQTRDAIEREELAGKTSTGKEGNYRT